MKKTSKFTNISSRLRHFSRTKSKEKAVLLTSFLVGAVILFFAVLNLMALFGFKHGEATLILAFENGGSGRMFTGEVVPKMTVLDALIASSEAGQIDLKYIINSDGRAKITELNSYTGVLEKRHLAFYLNNKEIGEGYINTAEIHAGDTIEVKLQ